MASLPASVTLLLVFLVFHPNTTGSISFSHPYYSFFMKPTYVTMLQSFQCLVAQLSRHLAQVLLELVLREYNFHQMLSFLWKWSWTETSSCPLPQSKPLPPSYSVSNFWLWSQPLSQRVHLTWWSSPVVFVLSGPYFRALIYCTSKNNLPPPE